MIRYIYSMHRIAFILLSYLFPLIAFGQVPDTILYDKIKLTCSDKFDKRPELLAGLGHFIAKKIRYPDEAREKNLQGRVYIQFTIEETGKVTKSAIVSSPHKSLSDEATRLVEMMPAWSPAIRDGKPVPVSLIMPLLFTLN